MAGCTSDQGSNWALLPSDIVIIILEKLVSEVSDYIHFAAVCKNWLYASCDHQAVSVTRKGPFFPGLLVPSKDKSEIHRGWYNAIENRVVNSRLHIPYNKRCCGSSNGWLIFPEETLALLLFNPFTGATIHLPPVASPPTKEEIKEFGFFYDHEYQIHKVVLSADPSVARDNYEALAIFEDGNLALFRCESSSWIHVKWDRGSGTCEEITCFNGKFYVASLHLLVRLDVVSNSEGQANSITVNLRKLASRMINDWVHKTYLVGAPDGHLLWIDRYYKFKKIEIIRDDSDRIVDYLETNDDDVNHLETDDDDDDYDDIKFRWRHFTSRFRVYEYKVKEEEVEGEMQLTELKTLGDQVLFLGDNDSELVSTRGFPEYRANCIYYMDDCVHLVRREDGTPYPFGAEDMGVFDLEGQCCQPLEKARLAVRKGFMPPPIWIVPKANLMLKPTL